MISVCYPDRFIKTEFSGTTAVICIIRGDHLYTFNVGDSRAILASEVNDECVVTELTHDHKPSLPEERARIEIPEDVLPLIADVRVFSNYVMSPEVADHCRRMRDSYIAKPEELGLTPDTDLDVIRFTAIKKVYDTKKGVTLKDLCLHYGYPYSKYYAYNRTLTPDEDTFVNILNPHRKK